MRTALKHTALLLKIITKAASVLVGDLGFLSELADEASGYLDQANELMETKIFESENVSKDALEKARFPMPNRLPGATVAELIKLMDGDTPLNMEFAGLKRFVFTRVDKIVCAFPVLWVCEAHYEILNRWDKRNISDDQLRSLAEATTKSHPKHPCCSAMAK